MAQPGPPVITPPVLLHLRGVASKPPHDSCHAVMTDEGEGRIIPAKGEGFSPGTTPSPGTGCSTGVGSLGWAAAVPAWVDRTCRVSQVKNVTCSSCHQTPHTHTCTSGLGKQSTRPDKGHTGQFRRLTFVKSSSSMPTTDCASHYPSMDCKIHWLVPG